MKKQLLLVPLLMTLAACNPSKDPVRGASPGGTNAGANLSRDFVLSKSCAQGQSGIGAITDSVQAAGSLYSTPGTFQDRVKALLSTTVMTADIGDINGSGMDGTGVRFQGVIKMDPTSGLVDGTNSKMIIKIYDSFYVNSLNDPNGTKYDTINLDFSPLKNTQISGQFNMQTGDGFLSFHDAYGDVRFEGRLDAQFFSGEVKFQNTKNVNGADPVSGTVGQFRVARCGIIQ